jgi:3-hydroxybutyryl-CoA dehydrogenase
MEALGTPQPLPNSGRFSPGAQTAEDVGRSLALGAGHPQGPLALVELIGLDTTKAVAGSLYEESK